MVEEQLVKMFKCKCDLCGHVWVTNPLPLRCAKCKRVEWNKLNKNTTTTNITNQEKEYMIQENTTPSGGSGDLGINYRPDHLPTCTCILCLLRKR